ncbi:hypothetical protein C8J56DRAFT_340281 [Mycena floridula]|nr:hypothetical protein C8J56DRAFT_340281 [Mycena floridula]
MSSSATGPTTSVLLQRFTYEMTRQSSAASRIAYNNLHPNEVCTRCSERNPALCVTLPGKIRCEPCARVRDDSRCSRVVGELRLRVMTGLKLTEPAFEELFVLYQQAQVASVSDSAPKNATAPCRATQATDSFPEPFDRPLSPMSSLETGPSTRLRPARKKIIYPSSPSPPPPRVTTKAKEAQIIRELRQELVAIQAEIQVHRHNIDETVEDTKLLQEDVNGLEERVRLHKTMGQPIENFILTDTVNDICIDIVANDISMKQGLDKLLQLPLQKNLEWRMKQFPAFAPSAVCSQTISGIVERHDLDRNEDWEDEDVRPGKRRCSGA